MVSVTNSFAGVASGIVIELAFEMRFFVRGSRDAPGAVTWGSAPFGRRLREQGVIIQIGRNLNGIYRSTSARWIPNRSAYEPLCA